MKKLLTIFLLTILALVMGLYSYNQEQTAQAEFDLSNYLTPSLAYQGPVKNEESLEKMAEIFKEKQYEANLLNEDKNEAVLPKNSDIEKEMETDKKTESNRVVETQNAKTNQENPANKSKIEIHTSNENIAFKTIRKENSSLPQGESRVIQQGKPGSVKIIKKFEVDGNNKKLLSENRETTLNPTDHVIEVGTKVELSGDYNAGMAKSTLGIVNAIRKQNGLSEVSWNNNVEAAARIRAKEIKDNFSHTRPNGQAWYTVSDAVMAENIAYGQRSSESVINSFMNSAVHRDNILNPKWTSMGVSLYIVDGVYYWVQLFA